MKLIKGSPIATKILWEIIIYILPIFHSYRRLSVLHFYYSLRYWFSAEIELILSLKQNILLGYYLYDIYTGN